MGKIHDTITSIQNMETEQLMIVLSKEEDVDMREFRHKRNIKYMDK